MVRDFSPKERQRQQLQRKQGQRASYDRILIVSEGSKTEPNYLGEIRQAYRLHTANVAVYPSQFGTAPIQVVQYAKQLFEVGDRHRGIQPRSFERVYALFDRDEHDSYFNALSVAQSLNRKLKNDNRQTVHFEAIASVPCFELWLLLHYEDVQAALRRDEVMRRLKTFFPDYEKGEISAFDKTRDKLPVAMQRARALATRFNAYSTPAPFTGIVEVVDLLINLRSGTAHGEGRLPQST